MTRQLNYTKFFAPSAPTLLQLKTFLQLQLQRKAESERKICNQSAFSVHDVDAALSLGECRSISGRKLSPSIRGGSID